MSNASGRPTAWERLLYGSACMVNVAVAAALLYVWNAHSVALGRFSSYVLIFWILLALFGAMMSGLAAVSETPGRWPF